MTDDIAAYFTDARNLFRNPGFESGALDCDVLAANGLVTPNVAVLTQPALSGNFSLRLGVTSGTNVTVGAVLLAAGWWVPVDPGDVYSVACDVGLLASTPSGSLSAGVRALFFSQDRSSVLASGYALSTTANTIDTERLELENQEAPAAAAWMMAGVLLENASGANVSGSAVFDDLMLNTGPVALPYVDGDFGGAYWDGLRFHAPSQRRGEAQSAVDVHDWVPPYWYDGDL